MREGIRVDEEGGKFGQRVAVKIISRRLIKKVCSPAADGRRALVRVEPLRVQRAGLPVSGRGNRNAPSALGQRRL